jgi:hypothetical protein
LPQKFLDDICRVLHETLNGEKHQKAVSFIIHFKLKPVVTVPGLHFMDHPPVVQEFIGRNHARVQPHTLFEVFIVRIGIGITPFFPKSFI